MSNATGRFEARRTTAFDDGWPLRDEDAPPPLRTTVATDATRTVITRNTSPDISFDRSINPYRGCEHGCVYCYARPSHAWLGLSPGLDFESRLFAKHDAAALLVRELAHPSYRPKLIALGTNTDPYQPIERKLQITRAILAVLSAAKHPVSITTKSDAVLRDRDILAAMAQDRTAHVTISITTLDPKMARTMEPRAAAPHRRLAAIKALAEAGVPVAVNVAPIIPGLTDHEIENILSAAADAGATTARYIMARLPFEVKVLFEEWLDAYFPDRKTKVLSLIRSMRSGKLNDANFGSRMTGGGPYADIIQARFQKARRRYSLDARHEEDWLDVSQFIPPTPPGAQLSLGL